MKSSQRLWIREKPASHLGTLDQARSFLADNVGAIRSEDRERLLSAGSGWRGFESIRERYYHGLGLDFLDVHVYQNDVDLPDANVLAGKMPIIIGEFGHVGERDDQLQAKVLRQGYLDAIKKGYLGIFPWQFAFPGDENSHSFFEKSGNLRSVAAVAKSQNLDVKRKHGDVTKFIAHLHRMKGRTMR